MNTRTVVVSELPKAEQERFFEFLIAQKVKFTEDDDGETFSATMHVHPPKEEKSCIKYRQQQAKLFRPEPQKRGALMPKPKARPDAGTGSGHMPNCGSPTKDLSKTLQAAQVVLKKRYMRFCMLLPSLVKPPQQVRAHALLRFAEQVYDARYERDSLNIKHEAQGGDMAGKGPQTFPDFVFEFASKKYGVKALVTNNCWGLVSSMEMIRGQHVAVDLFAKFIEESYDVTDLLFFLFMRSAIERVMSVAKEEKEEAEGPRKQVFAKASPRMDLKQVVQVVKMSIDHKTQDLRDQVIKKLDVAMAARIEGAGRRAPTLEPERLLAIAVEEYHLSRGLKDTRPEEEHLPTFEELSPQARKEVGEISSRLLRSLTQGGEKNIDPKQVREWALQTVLRRNKLGTVSPRTRGLTDWVEKKLSEMDEKGEQATIADLVPSTDVLNLSSEEFQENLETHVRQLLLNATAELIDDVMASLPQKSWKNDKSASSAMKTALISEFAPVTDVLMEAIVAKDYTKWLETLGIREGTDAQKDTFAEMSDDFQKVLGAEITVEGVQHICHTVVDPDELFDIVRTKAKKLSKLGDPNQKKLADDSSSSDDEYPKKPLQATHENTALHPSIVAGMKGTANFGQLGAS